MTFVKTFLRDENGASAAEYALILAVVGAGIAIAAFNLGEAVSESIGAAETTIDNCKSNGTGTGTAGTCGTTA
ncbi:Flp family type IVb pilin [Altererythrobacter xiamenensis]|nr:Flp family type IVb pilin [Altererythrobacter xiamenensis]